MTHLGMPSGANVASKKRLAWLVGFVAATTTRRRNILRACVAARYATDLALSPNQAIRAREQLRRVHDWLLQCRDEIVHGDPQMAARTLLSYLTDGRKKLPAHG